MFDKFIVDIYVENEDNLYNQFSNRESFSKEFIDFMITKGYESGNVKNILIRVNSAKQIDESLFAQNMSRFLNLRIKSINMALKRAYLKMLLTFFIGTFFIFSSLVLQSKIPVLPYTILSTIGAFSMWESAAVWIKEGPRLRFSKKIVYKFKQTHSIEFIYK